MIGAQIDTLSYCPVQPNLYEHPRVRYQRTLHSEDS